MTAGETNWRDGALLTAAFIATALGLYGAGGLLDFYGLSGLSGVPVSVFAAPFGLLVGVALFESWGPPVGLAIVSVPAFWAATEVTGSLANAHISLMAGHDEAFAFLVGSELGALVMAAAVAYWHRGSTSRFAFAAVAGAVAAPVFVGPWSSDVNLIAGFVVWQILVGWVLVGSLRSTAVARPLRNRRIIAIAVPALLIGAIGLALVPPSTGAIPSYQSPL